MAFMLIVSYRPDRRGVAGAIVLFSLAAITDKLDGVFARRFRIASYHGYLVDGFGDRTFSVACVLVGTVHHALPPWVALLAVVRELLLYTCRLIEPSAWHPPSRAARLHSLAVFGVTRLWFLGLLVVDLASFGNFTCVPCAWRILNSAYTLALVVSTIVASDTLLRILARCFDEEPL